MSQGTHIQIESAIAHQLNPHISDGVVYSTNQLPLQQQPKIIPFLQAHIDNSQQHHDIRTGRFKVDGAVHAVKAICHKLIAGKTDFVKGSRLLAEQLNDLLKKNKSISVGTFAVCLYRDAQDGQAWLALLKLDPMLTVVQRTIVHGQDTIVTWEPAENALPSTEQDLHKCALVKIPSKPNDFDLLILDWQRRGGAEPAHFFTTAFLGADLSADVATLTRTFHSTASNAVEDLRPDLGNQRADAAQRLIDAAVFSRRISVEPFVNSLDVPDKAADAIRTKLQSRIKEAFKPDKSVATKLTTKRTITGEYGLRLSVNSDHFTRVVKMSKTDKRDPQYGDYRELIVRAFGFREK
jgi:hypothetical protein